MLPNDEFNVNSCYARQDLRRDTRKVHYLRHFHRNNRLYAGPDAHRVYCCHSSRCSLHVIANSASMSRQLKQYVGGFQQIWWLYSSTASFKNRSLALIEITLERIYLSI